MTNPPIDVDSLPDPPIDVDAIVDLDAGLIQSFPEDHPYFYRASDGGIGVVANIFCAGAVYQPQYQVPTGNCTFAQSIGLPTSEPNQGTFALNPRINTCQLHKDGNELGDTSLVVLERLELHWARARGYQKKLLPPKNLLACTEFYRPAYAKEQRRKKRAARFRKVQEAHDHKKRIGIKPKAGLHPNRPAPTVPLAAIFDPIKHKANQLKAKNATQARNKELLDARRRRAANARKHKKAAAANATQRTVNPQRLPQILTRSATKNLGVKQRDQATNSGEEDEAIDWEPGLVECVASSEEEVEISGPFAA